MKLTIMPPIAIASENCNIEKWKGGKCNIVLANLSTVLKTYIILSISYPLMILMTILKSGKAIRAPIIILIKLPFEKLDEIDVPMVSKKEEPYTATSGKKSKIRNPESHSNTVKKDSDIKSRIASTVGEKNSTKTSRRSSIDIKSPHRLNNSNYNNTRKTQDEKI